jgi:hypothetical protein
MPRAAASTSDIPAAAAAPIVADTQSKPIGADGPRAIGAEAAIVLSLWLPHARRTAYSFAADAAIEDGGGGTSVAAQMAAREGRSIGLADAAGATIATAMASAASAALSPVVERI